VGREGHTMGEILRPWERMQEQRAQEPFRPGERSGRREKTPGGRNFAPACELSGLWTPTLAKWEDIDRGQGAPGQ
jgi:hypothetical protein